MTDGSGLHKALAAVQAELPPIGKDHKADTGKFSYTYASLNDVNRALLPILAAHNLTWTCTLSTEPRALVGTLTHAPTGERCESWWPLPATTDPQQLGSAVTYGRRYLLLAVTGSAPDEDDDGAAATRASGDRDAAAATIRGLRDRSPAWWDVEVAPKVDALVEYASKGPSYLESTLNRLDGAHADWETRNEVTA